MNLAASLLCAAERNPGAEAIVDGETRLTYAKLLDRVARVAGGLELERGERLAAVVRSRLDTVLLYWACQWLGATFVPLSPRASAPISPTAATTRARPSSSRWTRSCPNGEPHPGVLDADDDDESLMLYTSGTTGPPEGRAALAPRRPRGRPRAGVHQGYATATGRSAACRSTTRWASTRCSRCI